MKKTLAVLMLLVLATVLCGCSATEDKSSAQVKTFVLGDTTFNAENGEPDINPHRDNSGWACIRYGVGETLFRFSESMELEPWLAASFERLDSLTWRITLRL